MTSRPAFDVRTFAVPDHLSDLVTTIYRLDVDLPLGQPATELLLPEWGNMRFLADDEPAEGAIGDVPFAGSGFLATGPTSRSLPVELGRMRLFGFGLHPLGWASFVDRPASDLADGAFDGSSHPAFARLADLAAALRFATPDDMRQFRIVVDFLSHSARLPRDGERIALVQAAMTDPFAVQVRDLAGRMGMTVRTLERLCLKAFGFSPNVLLRRQRLVRSLAWYFNEGERHWTEAIDRHYHDHSHFVREFHCFMGMSPTEYAAQDHPIMRAFMEHRGKTWGVPVRSER